MSIVVQHLTEAHWPAVRAIYAQGIATGLATFETQPPGWAQWHGNHLPHSRVVACAGPDGPVLGWAALAAVSRRAVYAGVAEVSVYVATDARGQGVGQHLLAALVAASEAQGVWTLQATVFEENNASLALHARAGFRRVGYRERIAQLHGRWRNTVLLERRSPAVASG